MSTPYMQQLLEYGDRYQDAIERLLKEFCVQPVGDGYIDLILPLRETLELITELSRLPVVVETLTWWCNCTQESTSRLGCPHGMGGPLIRFGDGWFSECVGYPDFQVMQEGIDLQNRSIKPHDLASECSRVLYDYMQNRLPLESFYRECLCSGLWLHVPRDWKRRKYFK